MLHDITRRLRRFTANYADKPVEGILGIRSDPTDRADIEYSTEKFDGLRTGFLPNARHLNTPMCSVSVRRRVRRLAPLQPRTAVTLTGKRATATGASCSMVRRRRKRTPWRWIQPRKRPRLFRIDAEKTLRRNYDSGGDGDGDSPAAYHCATQLSYAIKVIAQRRRNYRLIAGNDNQLNYKPYLQTKCYII